MMYSEFVAATGCKDSPKNYEVYRHLEILYMNSDVTKEQIYEYGRKLVDNSKSQAELDAEARVKAQIKALEAENAICKGRIVRYQSYLENEHELHYIKQIKSIIKANREAIKQNNNMIRALKA